MKFGTLVFLALIIHLTQLAAIASTNEAKAFFEKYVELQRTYDPSLKDLYSEKALLKHVVKFSDGTFQTNTISAARLKQLTEGAMQAAKLKGVLDTYEPPLLTEEGEKVRIVVRSISMPDQKPEMTYLLIGPSEKGKWLIEEELVVVEAQPFFDQQREIKAKNEWRPKIIAQNGGTIRFLVSGDGPFSLVVVNDAAYEALRRKDQAALRQQGVVYLKKGVDKKLQGSITLEPGIYHFLITNAGMTNSQFRLQCYGALGR